MGFTSNTDAEARRDNQSQNYKGEGQCDDDTGRPSEQKTEKSRNKANEGLKQGRNES